MPKQKYLYSVDLITESGHVKPYKPGGRRYFPLATKDRILAHAKRRGLQVRVHRFALKTYPNKTHYTPHFTRIEFASKGVPDGAAMAPVPRSLDRNARRLALGLEHLRKELGGSSITLLSVYRTRARNEYVNGATRSQHMKATAADLDVKAILAAWSKKSGKRKTRDHLIAKIKTIDAFHGIGLYPSGGIHVDVRPGSRVFWNDFVGYR